MAICLICFIHPTLDAREHEISSSGTIWETTWESTWTWLLDLASDLSDDLHRLLPTERADVPTTVHGRSDSGDPSDDATGTGTKPDDPADLKGTIISSG